LETKLTPQANNALRQAAIEAGRWRDPFVTPEHLLLALMAVSDSAASRVFRDAGVDVASARDRLERYLSRRDDPEPLPGTQRAEELSLESTPIRGMLPRMGVILDRAAEAARSCAAAAIGTEHLLLGILQEGGSMGAMLLCHHGLHPVSLAATLQGRLPEAHRGRRITITFPAGAATASMAASAVAGLVFLAFWWLVLWLAMVAGLVEGSLQGALQATFVRNGWAVAIAVWSVPRGLRLERWAWPKMQALLFAASAGGVGLFVAVASGICPRLASAGGPLCFYAFVVTAIAVTLFRHRADFGVEKRTGWRTLRQEGGWILAVSGILELGTLGSWILSR